VDHKSQAAPAKQRANLMCEAPNVLTYYMEGIAMEKNEWNLPGVSARTARRYVLVLRTPAAVQRACDRGELSLASAAQVGLLPPEQQEKIARRIQKGEKAASVVAAHTGGGDRNRSWLRRASDAVVWWLVLVGIRWLLRR
jgi:hypothetical protein